MAGIAGQRFPKRAGLVTIRDPVIDAMGGERVRHCALASAERRNLPAMFGQAKG